MEKIDIGLIKFLLVVMEVTLVFLFYMLRNKF